MFKPGERQSILPQAPGESARFGILVADQSRSGIVTRRTRPRHMSRPTHVPWRLS
jgi:hypothetical protein